MKKEVVLLILTCLVILSSCGAEFSKREDVAKEVKESEKYSGNEVLVKFRNNIDLSSIPEYYESSVSVSGKDFPVSVKTVFSNNDIKKIKKLTSSGSIVLFEIEGDVHEAVKDFKDDPNVLAASLNHRVKLFDYPNDSLFNLTWSLDNTGQSYPLGGPGIQDADIDFPEALDLGYGDNDIVVAVIDSGVDYTHEDLANNMWTNDAELNGVSGEDDDGNGFVDDIYGYNFVGDGNSNINDTIGHGTHCAGIIAAETNNSIGTSGVCPNCKIMSLKIFPGGNYSDAIEAFSYAIDNGAKILSNSWGCDGGCENSLMEDAVRDAFANGALIVFAAGNDNINMSETYYSPQSMDDISEEIVVVSATDDSDVRASFSNYGLNIDVSAPGVNILSLRGNNTDIYCNENPALCGDFIIDETGNVNSSGRYYVASGTSMAAPYVAGLAGLIWSHNSGYTNVQINTQLKSSVDNISFFNQNYESSLGTGRINAFLGVSLSSAEHALGIEYVEAIPSKINETSIIKINISNRGTSDETGLQINFNVFGEFVETANVGDLLSGDNVEIELTYNFTNLYYNNISFGLVPVSGEYYLSDNYIDSQVWIYNYDSSPLISLVSNDFVDCEEQGLNPILGDKTGIGVNLEYLENLTLQNCYVGGWNDGLKLWYVSNSNFVNNTFSYNDYVGLTVSGLSENNSFSNSDFFSNNYGINLEGGSSPTSPINNIFYQNEIYSNNKDGMLLQGRMINNSFIDNKIFSNEQRGIMAEKLRYNLFESNIIEKNKKNGAYFDRSENISMYNNSFLNNSFYGLNFYNSSLFNISYNLFEENEDGGIILDYTSDYNNLFNNNLLYNKYGIILDNATNNLLYNNTLTQNIVGIYLSSLAENNYINNVFSFSNSEYDVECYADFTIGTGNFFSNILPCPNGWPSTDDYSVYSESIFGCTDLEASNYNPDAVLDDGSCEYVEDEPAEEEPPGEETEPSEEEDIPLDEDITVDLFENETVESLNLSVEPVQSQVIIGNELEVYVDISKESEDNAVNLDMGIFDESLENEFNSVSYVFDVENTYSGIANISIPRNISYGTYLLKARAYFSDNRSGVVSISNIEVIKKPSEILIFSVTLFVILSVLVFVIYYFIYKKKK